MDGDGKPVLRQRLRRARVLSFFQELPPCLVGMEACGSAHFWARELTALGHEVRLIPPSYVKPYVRRHKNDAADAAAICEAVTRPSMRFVPIKSEEQQTLLLAHRARDLLIRQRTSLINALRSHLAEFGIVLPKGTQHGRRLPRMILDGETFGLLSAAHSALHALASAFERLQREIEQLDMQLKERAQADATTRRLMKVFGIGAITSTALTATIGDGSNFRSAREFAAWIGLVPRQNSSGDDERLGPITKMGNAYLRRLLVTGAQAVLARFNSRNDQLSAWLDRLLREKPRKVAAVALANKMARICWALIVRNVDYRISA